MAPDDDDSRRNRDRPEDNPFISFRRFADSQVSSLLNTVFTIPATLANFNNAHHAREQCLFGQADPSQCEKLQQIEDEVTKIRSEGRELYKVGDLQAVLKKGERLMKLDREADELRKDIVERVRTRETRDDDARTQAELVERVGSEKGQQWAWSWSWGFPRPFDEEEEHTESDESRQRRRSMYHWRQRRSDEEARKQAEDRWDHFNARREEIKKKMNEEQPRVEDGQPNVWTWSFTWPPPADAPTPAKSANERPQALFDELGDMIVDEVNRLMLPRPFTFHDESYSPRALEKNEQLKKTGVQWRDAFEDLVRAERGAPLIPQDRLGQSDRMTYNEWTRRFWDPDLAQTGRSRETRGQYPKRVPWEGEETSEEPSYEYEHDHEDQHDDPPTPRTGQGEFTEGMPATELQCYERFLDPTAPSPEPANAARPSILSTLTTTERTVAPDGSVTTKVVLKKRFADGREESSETVHTQRGQDVDPQNHAWKAMQDAQFPSSSKDSKIIQEVTAKKDGEKKNGWFWSN